MIELVHTGIAGLDLVLGGGLPLVARGPDDRTSATVLIRGEAGVGKTAFATRLSSELARALHGSVAYACVELLPSELRAQHEALSERAPDAAVIEAPFERSDHGEQTRICAGMLDVRPDEPGQWLGESLVAFLSAVRDAGDTPKVLVVDALSAGYGLGDTIARQWADAVCKLAVDEGLVLLLLEERAASAMDSPWAYAVDVVIRLAWGEHETTPHGHLLVTKSRFGPLDRGDHRMVIARGSGVRVLPHPSAYLRPWARDLVGNRWASAPSTAEAWKPLGELKPGLPPFRQSVTLVRGEDLLLASRVARWLGAPGDKEGDVELDFSRTETLDDALLASTRPGSALSVGDPYASGSRLIASAIEAVDRFCSACEAAPTRVLMGDLSAIGGSADANGLRRAMIVLANVLREREVPLVMYESSGSGVAAVADVIVDVRSRNEASPVFEFRVSVRSTGAQTNWVGREP